MNKQAEMYADQLIYCKIKLSDIPSELKSEVLSIVNDKLLSYRTLLRRQIILDMIQHAGIDELSIDPQKRFHIR